MSYIGNAKTPLLLATNVRDDLVPNGTQATFNLSQEVPGGYEANVVVVRRRFLKDVLVENTNLVQVAVVGATPLSNPQITITDNYLAAVFSVLIPGVGNNVPTTGVSTEGDWIEIVYDDNSISLNKVTSVSYNRDQLIVELDNQVSPTAVTEGTNIKKISRLYYGAWEILDSERQYEIQSGSSGHLQNQIIKIKDFVPQVNDQLYVLHRGEATYNFVPSPASVGPDQLSPNLRDFLVDSQTYNTTGPKTLSLSRVAPTDKSLLVTVNGIVEPSEQEGGSWTLNQPSGTSQTITLSDSLFTNAVAAAVKVRVLHLSFSTVSRRASFAPGQEPTTINDYAVTSIKLASDSVTTDKIVDNSITGTKVLFNNNEALKSKSTSQVQVDLLKLSSANETTLSSPNSLNISVNGDTKTLSIGNKSVLPNVNSDVSLGSSSKKFKDVFSSNIESTSATINSLTITGNIQIDGTIDNTDVSILRDKVQNIEAALVAIKDKLMPVGTILIWASSTDPSAEYSGVWLVCDGRLVKKSDYPALYVTLGGDAARPWPWGSVSNITTNGQADVQFAVPDLRHRVPTGKGSQNTLGETDGVVENARSLSHTHSTAQHTHSISHTHEIPAHKHSLSGSTIKINDSGSHTQDISHGHTGSTQNPNEALTHTHTYTHGHGSAGAPISTGFESLQHKHSGATESGSSHRHNMKARLWRPDSTGYIASIPSGTYKAFPIFGSSEGFLYYDDAASNDAFIRVESSHTHPFYTGNNVESLYHNHTFFVPEATNTTNPPNNNLIHTHNITIPSSTITSISGGSHTHEPSSFTGCIGVDSLPEGSSTASLLATSSQSNLVSGAATYTTAVPNETSSSTVPHAVVNFIIKAKSL